MTFRIDSGCLSNVDCHVEVERRADPAARRGHAARCRATSWTGFTGCRPLWEGEGLRERDPPGTDRPGGAPCSCRGTPSRGVPGGSCLTLAAAVDAWRRHAELAPRPQPWVRADSPFPALRLAGGSEPSGVPVALRRSTPPTHRPPRLRLHLTRGQRGRGAGSTSREFERGDAESVLIGE